MYEENFGEKPFGDINLIKPDAIPDHDILLAGFPCQPFSIAGKQLGFADTRGTLFFDIERILKHHKPSGFILENVEGLVNHDKKIKGNEIGQTLEIILASLRNIGYEVGYKEGQVDFQNHIVRWLVISPYDIVELKD